METIRSYGVLWGIHKSKWGRMLLGTLRKDMLKDEQALGILLKACMGFSLQGLGFRVEGLYRVLS